MSKNIIIGSSLIGAAALAYYFLIYKKKAPISSMDGARYSAVTGIGVSGTVSPHNPHGCKNGETYGTHAGVKGCWGSSVNPGSRNTYWVNQAMNFKPNF